MSNETDYYRDIVRELLEQTEKDLVTWERTVRDERVTVSLENVSIDLTETSDGVVMRLLDESGTVLDRVDENDLPGVIASAFAIGPTPSPLQDLYTLARRSAYGVEGTLRDVISQLKKNRT